ncbi:unnamed protein product [Rotaria socialis]|uniref:FAM194 C-terminal domain-containing protein n=1 Tax=Rotaria socialis TaxID=392032 RepID=A0A820KLV6_9BILA|nr:unnamed protein product [Rotaria socialis]CAF4342131.1 unnamed protein product [Rotaria socialis]CAF4636293.1 unnamed protein product [Rotaria socialis]
MYTYTCAGRQAHNNATRRHNVVTATNKQSDGASSNDAAERRPHQLTSHRGVSSTTSTSPPPSTLDPDSAMAAKMRTLTYQLSNLKFVEEGWTLQRPPDFEISSDDDSDDDEQILVPRDLSSSALKKFERPLIQRFYKDGSKAAILFPNGTGCVYYPSGNVAISISEVARAMHLYTAFTDEPTLSGKQLAQFDPFGNGYCNFTNGDLRLQLTALEGVELNIDGGRRRRWNWWTKVNTSLDAHVHAPPFQPILFHLNNEIVIKICSQEKIYMKFSTELVEIKFKVGARLKVNNVNNLPSTQKTDPYENLLKKKNIILTRLLKNIQNEAQQYIRSQEQMRTAQQTTIISLEQQNRTKHAVKQKDVKGDEQKKKGSGKKDSSNRDASRGDQTPQVRPGPPGRDGSIPSTGRDGTLPASDHDSNLPAGRSESKTPSKDRSPSTNRDGSNDPSSSSGKQSGKGSSPDRKQKKDKKKSRKNKGKKDRSGKKSKHGGKKSKHDGKKSQDGKKNRHN